MLFNTTLTAILYDTMLVETRLSAGLATAALLETGLGDSFRRRFEHLRDNFRKGLNTYVTALGRV